MKTKFIIAILLLSFHTASFFAQVQPEVIAPKKSKMKSAEATYEKFAYIDAAQTYERIAKKGYKSVELFQKLGNSYYFNAQLVEANKWYTDLFDLNQPVDVEYYYRYAMSLKSVGDYKKSDKYLQSFHEKSNNDTRGSLFDKNKNYLEVIKKNSGRYKVQDAGINSQYSDYGTTFTDNKLIYASSRQTGDAGTVTSMWNAQAFTNLYAAELAQDGTLGAPAKFTKRLNSKFNEATPVFTKDGNTMYFTRNDFNKGKRGRDASQSTLLKIYKATMISGEWDDVTELPFNSSAYSVAHPALSADEKTLYFASDMPGTLGQSDLFKVKINSDGSFGTPVNLGKSINTAGRETFPHVTNDGELYFATDGHPGLGGLDVFVSKINGENSYSEPINVGSPVNEKTDDFAFVIDTKSRTGYFTSNRDGGMGFDDIYKFRETKRIICEQSLEGVVTDETTGAILAGAELVLSDSRFTEIKKVYADDNGKYNFAVNCGESYYIKTSKTQYEVSETKLSIAKESGATTQPIQLLKKVVAVQVGSNIADVFKIKMIYFDLDKSFVRTDAALELEKILDVLKQYPTMKIDVRSHTDSRATAQYNESLSDRRAKATIAWLIKNGIEAGRLTGKGYGESTLTNNCADGVDCTEQEHQTNRRSEFIIISL